MMKRRDFIKRTVGVAAASALGSNVASCTAIKPESKKQEPTRQDHKIKNVLFLFVDQQRADCLGCYGNNIVDTPNIDYLAKNGVRFANAFTPAAVCTPARTCVQTGVLAHRHGLIFNTGRSKVCGGQDDLSGQWPVFSTSLKAKGYNLAHIGKWHITASNQPKDFGYEGVYYPGYGYPAKHNHYLAYLKKLGLDRSISEKKHSIGAKFSYCGLQSGPQEASIPAYLANQTIEKLNEYKKSDKPFFICTSFWGPHAPYIITEKHFRMYDKAKITAWKNFRYDMSNKPDIFRQYCQYWGINHLDEKQLSFLIGKYYGYISLIDEEIGRIVKTLEANGMMDNTLIVYSADHGSTAGSHGMWDKGFGMYDCTQRIPLIMSHCGLSGTAYVSNEYVSLLDLAPTFLDMAGCPISEKTDGASLLPFLNKFAL